MTMKYLQLYLYVCLYRGSILSDVCSFYIVLLHDVGWTTEPQKVNNTYN